MKILLQVAQDISVRIPVWNYSYLAYFQTLIAIVSEPNLMPSVVRATFLNHSTS
jgi:hypothetical protein